MTSMIEMLEDLFAACYLDENETGELEIQTLVVKFNPCSKVVEVLDTVVYLS